MLGSAGTWVTFQEKVETSGFPSGREREPRSSYTADEQSSFKGVVLALSVDTHMRLSGLASPWISMTIRVAHR